MSMKPPVYSPSASIGNPATMPPRPIPNSSGSAPLPSVVAHVHVRCQRGEVTFSRNSNEAPRAISATSTSSSARYRPENSVAYQAGKAANIAGAGDDQPDLVAVPERADRAQGRPPLALVAPDDGVQDADAEVEALQDEEPGPEEGDDDEPEGLERHVSRSGPGRFRAAWPRRAGRAGRSGASARARSRRARCTAARRRRG